MNEKYEVSSIFSKLHKMINTKFEEKKLEEFDQIMIEIILINSSHLSFKRRMSHHVLKHPNKTELKNKDIIS